MNNRVEIKDKLRPYTQAMPDTLSGLETAWAAGAYGSEIDIQRTKDGHYVINHDSTFKRVAGDSRKPEEMTLREVKKLSIDGEPVPTFEEMLISSKGRIVLITDNVTQAIGLASELEQRSDLDRMVDKIKTIL